MSLSLFRPRHATRTLFLRVVAFSYACAFLSLYPQISGLYGSQGIIPLHKSLKPSQNGSKSGKSPALIWTFEGLVNYFSSFSPNLLATLPETVGLSPELTLDLVCLLAGGLAMALTLMPKFGNKVSFFVLWYCYLSVFNSTDTFLHFQWDTLLLEVGFLCVIVAPINSFQYDHTRPWDHVNMTLVKWLLFRMMFASGVVKLTSRCPAWWGLSALPTHYESQCLPTPLSWFAYQGSELFHQLGVIGTYVIEIPLTFLFFAPTRFLKRVTFFAQNALMINIMLTGNYNFFNILYMGLCVSLMDDNWGLSSSSSKSLEQGLEHTKVVKFLKTLLNLTVLAILVTAIGKYCFKTDNIHYQLTPELQFTMDQFEEFVAIASVNSVKFGLVFFGFVCSVSIVHAISLNDTLATKLLSATMTLFYVALALFMFGLSVPTFLYGVGQRNLEFVPKEFLQANQKLQHLQTVHSYGLFRSMTGVGGRPEVVIEGSAISAQGPWKEYHFLYKPGRLDSAPKFCLPHQPRLDWQMWFAALGTYQHYPWFASLMYRLLKNEPAVVGLLDPDQHPFPDAPPKFIRAQLYTYTFTSNPVNLRKKNPKLSKSEPPKPQDWWVRKLKGEYFPTFSLDTGELEGFMKKSGYLAQGKAPESRNKSLASILELFRDLTSTSSGIPPHIFIWSFAWIALPILMDLVLPGFSRTVSRRLFGISSF